MRREYRKESKRCVCATPGMTDELHHNPKYQTGKHLDPRCSHSELYNTLVRFPAMIAAQQAKRSGQAMRRNVGN